MARTTQHADRRVAEFLEVAAAAAERAGMEWNTVLSQMVQLQTLSPRHKVLAEEAFTVSARIGDYRGNVLRAIAADEDGER